MHNLFGISYTYIDSARFMANANLVSSLVGGIHKIKCKYVHDNKKCETCRIEHKNCECYLEYTKRIQMLRLQQELQEKV